jgi:hypothetical protein
MTLYHDHGAITGTDVMSMTQEKCLSLNEIDRIILGCQVSNHEADIVS